MLVEKVMSSAVFSVTAETTIRDAAMQMREHDVGALPVLQDGRPIGIVTDRDFVIRALAAQSFAFGPDTRIEDVMTRKVITCFADQDTAEAAALMGEERIRRLLVVDRTGLASGVLSVGDIAEHVSEVLAGQSLGEICEIRARDMPV